MGWSASLNVTVDGRRVVIAEAGEFQFLSDDVDLLDRAAKLSGWEDEEWRKTIDGVKTFVARQYLVDTLTHLGNPDVDHDTAMRIGGMLGRMVVASRLWPSATWELCY